MSNISKACDQTSLSCLESVWEMINQKEAVFLKEQRKYFEMTKPLKGLRILHNIPLSLETVCKIHSLKLAGAEVIATWPSNIIPTHFAKAKEILELAGVACLERKDIQGEFDFHLDCGAQLLDLPSPKIGCVELTGTGSQIYRSQNTLNYPVLSIDDSQTKALETFFGTADACVRALIEVFHLDLESKEVLLIGFGRVGRGVAYGLDKKKASINVIDMRSDSIKQAQDWGYTCALSNSKESLDLIEKAQIVITASGVENLISNHYDVEHFKDKILANVGAEDEFGPLFTSEQVLNHKQPVNFALKESTAMRYLDPSLYLHSYGCEILLNGSFKAGYHPLPKNVDHTVLERWQALYNEDLSLMKRSLS